jgi:hypothetical protein
MVEADEAASPTNGSGHERALIRIVGDLDMSDPRLSGTLTLTVDAERVGEGSSAPMVIWGSGLIENDAGSWTGTVAGGGVEEAIELPSWYVGEGAYDGLAAYLRLQVMGEVDGNLQFDGSALIYEGRPPVRPEALLPSEGLVAQGPAAVAVEGELVVTDVSDFGRRAETEWPGQIRQQSATGMLVVSDPRLAGEVVMRTNLDPYTTRTNDTASVSWGELTVKNLGGRWQYTWTGGADPGDRDEFVAYGESREGYGEWSARLRFVARPGVSGVYDVVGVAFEGAVPPQ